MQRDLDRLLRMGAALHLLERRSKAHAAELRKRLDDLLADRDRLRAWSTDDASFYVFIDLIAARTRAIERDIAAVERDIALAEADVRRRGRQVEAVEARRREATASVRRAEEEVEILEWLESTRQASEKPCAR